MSMDEKQYLTVAEYAELAGITTQAVYKKLKTQLKPYVVVVSRRKCIDISALKAQEAEEQTIKEQLFNQPNQPFQPTNQHEQPTSQPFQPSNQPTFQPSSQPNQPFQPIWEKQLEEKDKQIESLLRQIESLQAQNSNLTELLRNSQVLLAAEKKLMLEQADGAPEKEEVEEEAKEEVKESKGILNRLFGRRKRP